jgi:tetratricopeptide (TPR) repeat protein
MRRVRNSVAAGRLVLLLTPAVLAGAPAAADEASYNNAFDLRVTDIGSRTALDRFVVEAVNQGQYDQALSTLEEVILRNPADIGARIALARIYYQISSYDLAAAHIEQALLTAGWEAFEKEIEALKAKIDRAQSGWEYIFTISGGVDYKNVTETVDTFLGPDKNDGSGTVPYGSISGVVIRDLYTASSDEIRFGGMIRYIRNVGDPDFDNNYDQFDQFKGRAYTTYSKGLPDIVDTLRVDLTAYAEFDRQNSIRQINTYGAKAQISVRPSVESQLWAFVDYGWLGSSQNYYTDHRLTYGVQGEYRIAAGIALGLYANGYYEWGTSPEAFDFISDFDFETSGYEVGASVSHLLWVFEDGRSWVHEGGVRYTNGEVLDYASLVDFFANASLVDREAWEVFWNHTVQVRTDTILDFGVYYGEADYTNSTVSFDRSSAYWGVKGGLTFQIN